MANVEVKKGNQQGGETNAPQSSGAQGGQTSETSSPQGSQGSSQGMQRSGRFGQGGYGMQRQSSPFPSLFSLTPRDFFSVSPYDLFQRFNDEFNRLAKTFGLPISGFGQMGSASDRQAGAMQGGPQGQPGMMVWNPAIEILQDGNNLMIYAELPGVSQNDVNIEVMEDGLMISGERRNQREDRREGFYHSERSYGRFQRFIPLGENLLTEQARAEFNNGILEITIPMAVSEQRRRQIPIGSGNPQARAQQGTQGGQGASEQLKSASGSK